MLAWKILELDDYTAIGKIKHPFGLYGSDTSLTSLYLLQKKYDIECALDKGTLFRYYNGQNSRKGYGFPLYYDSCMQKDKEQGSILPCLYSSFKDIISDSKSANRPVEFCLCNKYQKEMLDNCLIENKMPYYINWKTNRDDTDYIYETQKLARLSGKAYHKKKNHVSKFMRTYEEWKYESLSPDNANDALEVAALWLEEREAEEKSVINEFESIKKAINAIGLFNIMGGILYVEDKPVAMTLASYISDEVCDVHFEKAIGEYAEQGAYAVINQCFAVSCPMQCTYLNREEDIGIEGLRKAKLSYRPDILLDKYYGRLHRIKKEV